MKEGYGIYYDSDGDIYEGEHKNDFINGIGIYHSKNGNKYEGEFKNGERDGYGTFYFNNGDKYEGEFKNDVNYGYGIFYSSLGFKYKRFFRNDRYEQFLFCIIYPILLFLRDLCSILIKRKISALLFIIILIIGYMIQKNII